MRVLFAAADRDLLACYEKILKNAFGSAVTAFTGAQALAAVAEGSVDAVVVDSEIPLVGYGKIVSAAAERGMKAVVLTCDPELAAPCAVLRYPFAPEKLTDILKEKETDHE